MRATKEHGIAFTICIPQHRYGQTKDQNKRYSTNLTSAPHHHSITLS
jgi:hypothetical protein